MTSPWPNWPRTPRACRGCPRATRTAPPTRTRSSPRRWPNASFASFPRSRAADWDYSNFGFQALSLALERAAGSPFGVLLDLHVFGPLEMTCSGVAGRGGGTRVQGHAKGRPVAAWTHRLWGAGGVEASAEDMARYLSACLLPPDSVVGRAIRLAQHPRYQIDPLRSAGLGWALGPPGYLGHDGGTSGFRAMLGLRQPARRAAAVVASDRGARGLAQAVRRLLDAG